MKKVYVVYQVLEDDGDDSVIEGIFATRESAARYIINSRFAWDPFYEGRTIEFLHDATFYLIFEHDLLP